MGDPKRKRKSYETPKHPWNKERIFSESTLVKEFGLKNKKELWKMQAKLTSFKKQAKNLVIDNSNQGVHEKNNLMTKVKSLGLISAEQEMGDILALTVRDVLNRRLQTVLVKLGLCRTVKQSRQFITHKHIIINNTKIDVPSYLVRLEEEKIIDFANRSKLNDDSHPERKMPEVEEEVVEEETKEKEAKTEIKKEEVKEKTKVEETKKEVVKEETKVEEVKTETKKEEVKEETKVEEAKKENKDENTNKEAEKNE